VRCRVCIDRRRHTLKDAHLGVQFTRCRQFLDDVDITEQATVAVDLRKRLPVDASSHGLAQGAVGADVARHKLDLVLVQNAEKIASLVRRWCLRCALHVHNNVRGLPASASHAEAPRR
jgi:hypothetical protein